MPGVYPAVGDILEITHVWRCDLQIAENTVHYRVSSVIGGGLNCSQIAANFANNAILVAAGLLPEQASYYGAKCRNLVAPQTRSFHEIIITDGTVGSSVVPKQVSGVISIYTPLAGQKNRGRVYFPFLPTTFADPAGRLSAAGYTAWNTNKSNFIPLATDITAGPATVSLALVVRHGRGEIAFPVPAGTATTADTLITQRSLGTQRRRGDYGRVNANPF